MQLSQRKKITFKRIDPFYSIYHCLRLSLRLMEFINIHSLEIYWIDIQFTVWGFVCIWIIKKYFRMFIKTNLYRCLRIFQKIFLFSCHNLSLYRQIVFFLILWMLGNNFSVTDWQLKNFVFRNPFGWIYTEFIDRRTENAIGLMAIAFRKLNNNFLWKVTNCNKNKKSSQKSLQYS